MRKDRCSSDCLTEEAASGDPQSQMRVTVYLNGRPFQSGIPPLGDLIDTNIRRSSSTQASIAFVRRSGLDRVGALRDPTQMGKIQLYAGMDFGLTEGDALKELIAGGARIGVVRNVQLGPPKIAGVFHPKVWLWKMDDQAQALIGSANLSESAVNDKNTEVCVLLEGSMRDALFQQLRSYFDCLKSASEQVTMVNFAAIVAELKRRKEEFARSLLGGGDAGELPDENVRREEVRADTVRIHVADPSPADEVIKTKLSAVVAFEGDVLPRHGDHVYFSTWENWSLTRGSLVAIIQLGGLFRKGQGNGVALGKVAIDSALPVSPDVVGKRKWEWELAVSAKKLRPYDENLRVRDRFQRVIEILGALDLPPDTIELHDRELQVLQLELGFFTKARLRVRGLDNFREELGL